MSVIERTINEARTDAKAGTYRPEKYHCFRTVYIRAFMDAGGKVIPGK